ncbi:MULTISPECIES: hypothetical protein [unclassified Streptomyces]|uniref:hypothetical protein n=1 Tax=unclassified Streptomyces TaxID=2593676 RepID=UPI0006FB6C30|nr:MULTISPECIES: hypothetical protein [unclassified Streptomyces]KQX54697.1 hypothetical protein ASD33_32255 [Streptomyces sp. Root1304]KRA93513.1 hypothetical protein ASE09_32040 [Streptomyces sp. Root66D1]
MNTADEGRQRQLDAASVINAKKTLLQLLARAGVYTGDAEELIGLVETGALSLAHAEVDGIRKSAPEERGEGNGEEYAAGWADGARTVTDALGVLAEQALVRAVTAGPSADAADERSPVRRAEMERTKVAVTPLYLSFSDVSDLDPEVTEQVLGAVLRTMSPRQRAGYPGRLAEFTSAHQERLERLYAEYGPGSPIAVHGRYSLVHSPTSVAVLERLAATPSALHEEWDAAELPPAWLDGLTTAWGSPA